jgi:hypothetical protein
VQPLLGTSHFIETLKGSFSAAATPLIARVGAFFKAFQDLQSFAPFLLFFSSFSFFSRARVLLYRIVKA